MSAWVTFQGKETRIASPGERAKTHRLQHVTGLHFAGTARRTRADSDPFQIERDHLHAGRARRARRYRWCSAAAGSDRRRPRPHRPPRRVPPRRAGRRAPARSSASPACAAAANPAISATAGVPPRRPRSWPPPPISGSANGASGASSNAPTPAGPPSLCEEIARLWAPSSVEADRHAPGGLDRIHMQHRAVPPADRGGLAPPAGSRPVSLLASIRQTSEGTPSAQSPLPAPRDRRRRHGRTGTHDRAGGGGPDRVVLDRTDQQAAARATCAWIARASASVPPEVNTRSWAGRRTGRRSPRGRPP